MGLLQLSSSDTSLNYDANPMHKLAEISPVFLWEDCVKEGWTKAEQIEKIFNSFITTRYFFSAGLHGGLWKEDGKYGVASAMSLLWPTHTSPTSFTKSHVDLSSLGSHFIVPCHSGINNSPRSINRRCIRLREKHHGTGNVNRSTSALKMLGLLIPVSFWFFL